VANLTSNIQTLKDAIAEFEAQYTRYTENDVNSAGSRSRKALMTAKKEINGLRKVILEEQKAKKAERRAKKADAKAAKAAKAENKAEGKKGKKGKKGKAAEATEESSEE